MKQKMLLAAGAAFAASWAGFQYYAARLEEEVAGGPRVPVLVVTEDLAVGSPLEAKRLASVDIPSRYVDDRRVLLKDRDRVLGGELATELKAGQSLLWSDVATAEGPLRLSLVLPRGRRAYTLPSAVNPMGPLLRADDEVDVLLLREGKTQVLLEKVRVVGVGRVLRGDKTAPSEAPHRGSDDVTLDVTLPQAQRLMEAERGGKLRLILRHPDDEGVQAPVVSEKKAQAGGREDKTEIEHVR